MTLWRTAMIALHLAALVPATLRWLRVAQREHYLAGSATRFASRWWRCRPLNLVAIALGLGGVAAAAAGVVTPVSALVVAAGPIGLRVRGRTSALVWTRRLRATAFAVVAIDLALLAGAALSATWSTAAGTALVFSLGVIAPVVVDVALAVLARRERAAMGRFVEEATAKLRAVHPTVVAITGSYGKTTTKNYLRHLVAGSRSVLASPASFNNTGGLARTMNEHLAVGTDVLIAEMGTYGPGEITALCRWVQPSIAAIVNIGPVHLERMRTLETVIAAKSEILADVDMAVLNIDAPGMAATAVRMHDAGRRVIRVSATDPSADVCVLADGDGWAALVNGLPIAAVHPSNAAAANVASAIGLAMALEVDLDAIARRLADLPPSEHRQQVTRGSSGATVIDNTFSSNPASAHSSLQLMARIGASGRRIVVTPGMVELGPVQGAENERFAEAAAATCDAVVIVGRTNRGALAGGAAGGRAEVVLVDNRAGALEWVKGNAGPDDVVLYEGDLPDHYP